VATVFQWHQDNFVQLPPNAELIASSPACVHQAFAIRQHLAMPFHGHPGQAYPLHVLLHPDSVQDPARMHAATQQHLAASQAMADRIYRTWRSRWPS